MAFLGKCAIRMSSPSIWKKLSSMGLKKNPLVKHLKERTLSNPMCVVVERGTYFCVKQDYLLDYIHDCGDNKALFFALAALRDDSDIHQWFIYDNRSWDDENPTRFWFQCNYYKIEVEMGYDQMYTDCEKATVQEIIYHFTGQDDDEEKSDIQP